MRLAHSCGQYAALIAALLVAAFSSPDAAAQTAGAGRVVCYDLIVADFNSYFVGQNRVLVHDNNLRQVTTATVPGLVQE